MLDKPLPTRVYIIISIIVFVSVITIAVVIYTNPTPINESATAFNPESPMIAANTYLETFVTTGRAHVLLDVRTPEEYAADGHLTNSVNISLQTLSDNLDQLPIDQPIIIYCRSGNRSQQAAALLRDAGYTAVYDLGGINQWRDAGYPVIQ